jgi:hypothetical protein
MITKYDNWYDMGDKLYLLRSYINILKNSDKNYQLAISYFTILHNFLIIERMFYEDVKLANKEINKYLQLEKLDSEEEVYNKFLELYDNEKSIIRINVETLDNIEPIDLYLKANSKVYTELLKK